MLHHWRRVVFGGDDVIFFLFIHWWTSEKNHEAVKGTRREKERTLGGVEVNGTRLNEKRGLKGGGVWFRGINPLMFDVHAPAGTTSASTYTRGISIIWIVKVFGLQLQLPNLCSPPPCWLSLSRRPLRETSHETEYRCVPRILFYVFYGLENPFTRMQCLEFREG